MKSAWLRNMMDSSGLRKNVSDLLDFLLLRLFYSLWFFRLSLDSEGSQVSSGLQDSVQYSSRSTQCCRLEGFDPPTDFNFFPSLLQDPKDRSKLTNYMCNTLILLFHSFLQLSCKVQCYLFSINYYELWSPGGIERSICKSETYKMLWVTFARIYTGLCKQHLVLWSNFNSTWMLPLFLIIWELITPALADGFNWRLRDSKFPRVFRTLLSILANLNNAVDRLVSTCPLISKSSSFLINYLGIVRSAIITVGITSSLCSIVFFFQSSNYY